MLLITVATTVSPRQPAARADSRSASMQQHGVAIDDVAAMRPRRSRGRRRRRTPRPAGSCCATTAAGEPRRMRRPAREVDVAAVRRVAERDDLEAQSPRTARAAVVVVAPLAMSTRDPRAGERARPTAAAAARARGTRRRSRRVDVARPARRPTRPARVGHDGLDRALVGLAELLAAAREHLDAVVAVRIVRGRQHDAEIEVERAGQIRHRRASGTTPALVTVGALGARRRARARARSTRRTRACRGRRSIRSGRSAVRARTIAAPSRATVGGSSGHTPATPRTPSVPNSRAAIGPQRITTDHGRRPHRGVVSVPPTSARTGNDVRCRPQAGQIDVRRSTVAGSSRSERRLAEPRMVTGDRVRGDPT